jgi:hypothetical protein
VVRKGKTPVLLGEEARKLVDSISTETVIGLRDRALIALLVYTFWTLIWRRWGSKVRKARPPLPRRVQEDEAVEGARNNED